MNEAETRAEHIDPALKAAGWGEVEGSRVLREHPITLGRLQGGGGKRTQALMADYVLVYRNTKLAVIEAKAWDKPHTEGTAQALTYAQRLGVRYAYATNGQQIYRIDRTTGAEGDVAAYPSPQALWQATFAEVNAAGYDALLNSALKGKGEPWGYENMNAWLLKPNTYAPGTRMAFAGIANTQQRADVIAYLKSISPKAPEIQAQ